MHVEIRLAKTDAEIAACYVVMRELRPHVAEESFVARVRAQEEAGYLLAYLTEPGGPAAVAGFRICENLAWGRFLYVDDLATLPSRRSCGLGAAILSWLAEFAVREGCQELHLDSGVQRTEAHRFYEREEMRATCLHFCKPLARRKTP